MLAMNDVDSLGHHFLRMVTIDRLNNVTSDQTNSALEPQSAYWNSATNTWIAAGYKPPTTSTSARWGSYNPTDGSEQFSAHALGYVLGTHVVIYRYVVNPLPGGDIGVILNTIDATIPSGTTYSHLLEVLTPNHASVWIYPTSGTVPGHGLQMASLSASAPVYAVSEPDETNGGNHSIDKLNWAGTLQWSHTHQPVQTIYPTTEGFFGTEYYAPTQAIFLEHYIDASNSYDFGRSYFGTSTGVPIVVGFTFFQNYFYVVNSVSNTTTNYDLVMERFVTGITLSSVTCANAVKQNTQLAVTIHLNGNVAGSPMTVALNSSSAKLLLPNGTRGQNFQIPVGQNSLLVMLNAQPVTSNTSLLLTAIQNGVRRTVATTVTP